MAGVHTIYFGTNRMPQTDASGDKIIGFGSELGPIDGTAVRFGSADVRVTARGASIVPDSLFVAPEKLRHDMQQGGRPTLVVVHGFSNSFTDAIERAATIRDFYGVDMNIFAFTWPSRGSDLPLPLPYVDYIHDRETARGSGLAMARTMRILYDYIDRLGTGEICRQPLHLICHSMGNYAFRHAVQALLQLPVGAPRDFPPPPGATGGERPADAPVLVSLPTEEPDPNRLRRTFDQIILAAADEDDDAFDDSRELKYLPRLASGVTVYHTSKDWILDSLSNVTKLNGPRLGTNGPDNMGSISDKVTAVDVGDVIDIKEDIQSHQYYRIFAPVRDDIVAVLKGVRPNQVPNREPTASQRYRIKPRRRR
jgi:esterase/lipase superfamily enzyme